MEAPSMPAWISPWEREYHADLHNKLTQFLPQIFTLSKPLGTQLRFSIQRGRVSNGVRHLVFKVALAPKGFKQLTGSNMDPALCSRGLGSPTNQAAATLLFTGIKISMETVLGSSCPQPWNLLGQVD